MIFSENLGIKLTEELKSLLVQCKEQEKSQRNLAQKIGVKPPVLQNWLGTGSRKGVYITWDLWEKVRLYLIAHSLINGSDPRWMTPLEMREQLISNTGVILSKEEQKLIQDYRECSAETKNNICCLASIGAATSKELASKSS